MRRTVKEAQGEAFIIEEYDNFRELIANNRKRSYNFDSDRVKRVRKGWEGVDSYEEAEELLLYGWADEAKLKVIKDKVNKLQKTKDRQRIAFKNDIVGFAPIVPNAIIGIPQSMINTCRVAKKSKVVTLVIDGGFSAVTNTSTVIDWGAQLISKIMNLEKSGYRVRLEYADYYCSRSKGCKNHSLRVLLKNENQPFDIKRMMFALAHPAMLRVISFEWYRKLPEAEYMRDYGVSIHDQERSRKEFLVKETVDLSKNYFISVKDNLDDMLKDLK